MAPSTNSLGLAAPGNACTTLLAIFLSLPLFPPSRFPRLRVPPFFNNLVNGDLRLLQYSFLCNHLHLPNHHLLTIHAFTSLTPLGERPLSSSAICDGRRQPFSACRETIFALRRPFAEHSTSFAVYRPQPKRAKVAQRPRAFTLADEGFAERQFC